MRHSWLQLSYQVPLIVCISASWLLTQIMCHLLPCFFCIVCSKVELFWGLYLLQIPLPQLNFSAQGLSVSLHWRVMSLPLRDQVVVVDDDPWKSPKETVSWRNNNSCTCCAEWFHFLCREEVMQHQRKHWRWLIYRSRGIPSWHAAVKMEICLFQTKPRVGNSALQLPQPGRVFFPAR